jgi:hypothetical protein
MPPRIAFRTSNAQSTAVISPIRQRASSLRCFSSTPSRQARQTLTRRKFWAWLNGPGQNFKHPLPGSTNYVGAYNPRWTLSRLRDDDDKRGSRKRRYEGEGEENDDVFGDGEDATEQELRGNDGASDIEALQLEKFGKVLPKEKGRDLNPFPENQYFKSQSVLSEETRELIYEKVAKNGEKILNVSASFGVSMARVAAVVRMKDIEKQWVKEVSSTLAQTYLHDTVMNNQIFD